jgi:hypothetical protein
MSIAHLAFVDIETVPGPDTLHELFEKKFAKEIEEESELEPSASPNYRRIQRYQDVWNKKAALHAEFGKIVAISIGKWVMDKEDPNGKFYIRQLTGRHEHALLSQAAESIAKTKCTHLCAHNGKEFDFPYLQRRFMVNGLPIPELLITHNKKSWDLKWEDTMAMWGAGAWNYKISLELLCHVLGVKSPKTEMGGADVAKIYYDSFIPVEGELPFVTEENAMKRIGGYCDQDVLAVAQCYCRMKGLPPIENIEYV